MQLNESFNTVLFLVRHQRHFILSTMKHSIVPPLEPQFPSFHFFCRRTLYCFQPRYPSHKYPTCHSRPVPVVKLMRTFASTVSQIEKPHILEKKFPKRIFYCTFIRRHKRNSAFNQNRYGFFVLHLLLFFILGDDLLKVFLIEGISFRNAKGGWGNNIRQ